MSETLVIPRCGWNVNDFAYVSHVQIEQLAKQWNINPAREPFLLWILQEALEAPLPPSYSTHRKLDGSIVYRDLANGEESSIHPAQSYYLELVEFERGFVVNNVAQVDWEEVWHMYHKSALTSEQLSEYQQVEVGTEETLVDEQDSSRSLNESKSEANHPYYYYNYELQCYTLSETYAREGVVFEPKPEFSCQGRSIAVQMQKSIDSIGRKPKLKLQEPKFLTFSSWWNKVNTESNITMERWHLTIRYFLGNGHVQVSHGHSDKVFTISHLQNRHRQLNHWDLHIGATINILGRRTTLQSTDKSTEEWLQWWYQELSSQLLELSHTLSKYDLKLFHHNVRSCLKVDLGKLRKSAKNGRGKINLRNFVHDIHFLRERLRSFRPSLAEKYYNYC